MRTAQCVGWSRFKPWASVATITVIYSDGFARTVAAFPEEDGVEDACSEDNLGPILDKAVEAWWRIHRNGENWYRGYGRGQAYPCLVKVAWIEGTLFTEPTAREWKPHANEGFESLHRAEVRVVRTYDVSGYAFMDELMNLLSEWQ